MGKAYHSLKVLGFSGPRRLIDVHTSEAREAVLSFGSNARSREPATDAIFEDLFLQHYPRLVKTLLRLVGDPAQAEELAADAFYRLHQYKLCHRPEENPAGWLYRTAMNLGLDALRANSRRARREAQAGKEALLSKGPPGPLDDLLAEEKRRRVRAVIAELKPVEGQVLLMGSSGFSCKEMAVVLGVKTDSLYVLTGRAKARFEKKYLQMYGSTE